VDVEDQAIADSLMEVVRSIPNERRRNAMLAHIAGMTLTEIGESMGVTRSRAGQLVDEARRNVRARWGA
jgi:DNA-directed RNA polymerase specialized sigma24 family protein